jgi:hypothetical protein
MNDAFRAVTLPLAHWARVLEVLSLQPWRDVNTLISEIHRQTQPQATTASRFAEPAAAITKEAGGV